MTFTIRGSGEARSRGIAACTSARGAIDVDLVDAAQLVEGMAARGGAGQAPRVLALLTTKVEAAEACRRGDEATPVAGVGDVAGDRDHGRAVDASDSERLDASSSSGAVRASTTSDQPRQASPAARARPRPFEAPVTIATGIRHLLLIKIVFHILNSRTTLLSGTTTR